MSFPAHYFFIIIITPSSSSMGSILYLRLFFSRYSSSPTILSLNLITSSRIIIPPVWHLGRHSSKKSLLRRFIPSINIKSKLLSGSFGISSSAFPSINWVVCSSCARAIFSRARLCESSENSILVNFPDCCSKISPKQIAEYPFAVPISSMFFAPEILSKSHKKCAFTSVIFGTSFIRPYSRSSRRNCVLSILYIITIIDGIVGINI